MASSPYQDGLDDEDLDHQRNPHASSSRWRHAESSAYLRYERDRPSPRPSPHPSSPGVGVARDAEARTGGVSDLADFFNKSRVDPDELRVPGEGQGQGQAGSRPVTPRFKPVVAGAVEARAATAAATNGNGNGVVAQDSEGALGEAEVAPDGKGIVCGPLLNYRRMEGGRWVGSVLVVVAGGGRTWHFVPRLELRRVDGEKGTGQGMDGVCLYSDPRNTFWRFDLVVDLEPFPTKWEYELPGLRFASDTKPRANCFHVPAWDESMRIMFHSCNGFSVGTDEEAWSGPALWNDVMRRHQERPFHVM